MGWAGVGCVSKVAIAQGPAGHHSAGGRWWVIAFAPFFFFFYSSLIKLDPLFLPYFCPSVSLPVQLWGVTEWRGGGFPQTVVGYRHPIRKHCSMLTLLFRSAISATCLSVSFITRARIQAMWTFGPARYSHFIVLHTYSSNHLCGIAWFLPLFHNSFSRAGNFFNSGWSQG